MIPSYGELVSILQSLQGEERTAVWMRDNAFSAYKAAEAALSEADVRRNEAASRVAQANRLLKARKVAADALALPADEREKLLAVSSGVVDGNVDTLCNKGLVKRGHYKGVVRYVLTTKGRWWALAIREWGSP